MKVLSLASFLVVAAAVATVSAVRGPAPDLFVATFSTTVGNFDVNCTRAYSPYGVDRFYELVTDRYYDGNGFFRVVPGFVVQFGINGSPAISGNWSNANIPDDPVIISNIAGTISYADAGPNTRTTQLFINYADNSFLDGQGFTPFCQVMGSLSVPLAINSQYGENPDQDLIYSQGNSYLQANFPNLSYINTVRIKKSTAEEND